VSIQTPNDCQGTGAADGRLIGRFAFYISPPFDGGPNRCSATSGSNVLETGLTVFYGAGETGSTAARPVIYFIKAQEEAIVKLATFRSGGREKIGLVHSNDSRLFDLATAADRDGKSNLAFASMLQLIDAGPSALDQARKLFDNSGKDDTL
jgi:hypothetical protein